MTRTASKKSDDCSPRNPARLPATDKFWQGEPKVILLNQKLTLIDDAIQSGYAPLVTVVYFAPDTKKDGGSYQECTGKVRQVDQVERKLVFLAVNERSAGKEIIINDILEIHGDQVDYMDDM